MAMWHAWLRNAHASIHPGPILQDRRSVELVPEEVRERVVSAMQGFSEATADAIVAMAVIRHRVLFDRLPAAHECGLRQLVVLGAGLDTTAFALPSGGDEWRVFEVDEPATQAWKRERIASLGWRLPLNLVFAPCDFEVQSLLEALEGAGFDRALPALVSLFGVVLYLTADATRALLADLATLAPGSEVILTYSPPSDGTDPIVQEVWDKASPVADDSGEGFVGYYRASDMERLVREAGFREAIHHPLDVLNKQYFSDRSGSLRLHAIEQLLSALC